MTIAELFVTFGLQPKGWAKGNQLIQGLASATRRLIGFEAVRSLTRMALNAAKAGTEVLSLSKQFGLSSKSIQEWDYVARQSGSNIKQFGAALSQIERNLISFAHGRGSKDARAAFEMFGITQAKAAKALTEPDGLNTVLYTMADRAKALGNRALVSGNLLKIAGRYAQGFAADLEQGSDRIKGMVEHVNAIGGVVGDKQLNDLKNFDNRLTDLKASFHGLLMQGVAVLAPQLTAMFEGAARWIARNRDLINGGLVGALTALRYVVSAVGAVVSWLGGVIHRALAGDTGAKAIVVGLAAAIVTVLLPALYAMAVPIVTMMAPLLAVAAVVAALAYAIWKWGPAIQKGLGDALDWVGRKAKEAWQFITSLPDLMAQGLADFASFVKDEVGAALDWIDEKAHDVWNDIKQLPIIGTAIRGYEAIYHAGRLLNENPVGDQVNLTKYGGAIDAIRTPTANVSPSVNNSNSASNVTNHINVTAPIRVDGSKSPADTATAISDHLDNELRQTLRGTGGNVQ